ncbi:hydrocephalus-inducing protein-like [Manduca sexta]|uniref:hydrocephalus-inducing protein-like n=1 Tax=Manduca sexta TaxID=7130 RepID=UPI00188F1D63|nr:hydrocephalus-inducing protein-like [Manduca sexta]
MVVLDSSGKYEPGEGGWLSVAFKPTMEMTYEGLLIFRFHMNPTRMTIPVSGQGILPQVHIIGPHVNFSPTLPWAETTDVYFGLTNPCPFPIELIVAHSDEKWKEEDEIYQLLTKYYNKPDEMLVPAIRPGTGLPFEIINFYKKFTEKVTKALEEESAAARALSTRANTAAKKTAKGSKPTPKSTTPKEATPRKFRTEAEIVADEIKSLKENNVDPLKECLHVFDHSSTDTKTDKNMKGLLVFVHGSPCEEAHCQEIAYSIGKRIDLPTINVDLCIVEALCICDCPAKQILTSAIHETFEMSQKHAKGDSDDNDGVSQGFNS